MTTQGGKRKGAGRKPALYKTKTISFRIREQYIEDIKQLVKNKLQQLCKQNTF